MPLLTLTDIQSAQEVVLQKEAADKQLLDGIATPNVDELRTKLVQWALLGYPNAHKIMELKITSPPVCSDGQVRELADYIQFCSGKLIHEHVALLQEDLPDFSVGYVNSGSSVDIVVSKPEPVPAPEPAPEPEPTTE